MALALAQQHPNAKLHLRAHDTGLSSCTQLGPSLARCGVEEDGSRLAANGPRRLMMRRTAVAEARCASLSEAARAGAGRLAVKVSLTDSDGGDSAGQAEWHVCVDDVCEGQPAERGTCGAAR